MANIYFHRFHAVTNQSRTRGRIMLTSLWYVSWKKQKCLQLCCKKLFPIIGLNVCKTCVLEVSPKSVWQLFHFFYLNLCEYFQRNFVEISSIFDDNNAFQSKQKTLQFLRTLISDETTKSTRCKQLFALQATCTKRCKVLSHCRQVSTLNQVNGEVMLFYWS